MKNSEIIEGNKLIAQFLGLQYGYWIPQQKPLTDDKKQWCDLGGKTFLGTRAYYNKDLKFHSLYDWIMPVVDKINKRDWVTIYSDECRIHSCQVDEFESIHIIREGEPMINPIWIAVVEYIKIYNTLENI